MAAERFLMVMGLEVADDAGYAVYRERMAPILESFGGSFSFDFLVSKVLRGDPRINRVFAISFPDRRAREAFFEDERYRAVRTEFFEPSVAGSTVLGEFTS